MSINALAAKASVQKQPVLQKSGPVLQAKPIITNALPAPSTSDEQLVLLSHLRQAHIPAHHPYANSPDLWCITVRQPVPLPGKISSADTALHTTPAYNYAVLFPAHEFS
ncbi:hypothetical protein FW774_06385 [Pedobacter sp. BS3]|uniref:hypothetical protein n=1 Tax=Pedobacter sp. BS3 TaxID=2567937 RepID=UPI0011EE4293|nr:hypothetical protein [Pedobacter sp. BS3]TZF84610.1 hypothetical protein FW774_06385 [Pedobacter sp. BS3]